MKIVEVTWYDVASSCGCDALCESDAKDIDYFIVKTVGHLLEENRESILVVMERYTAREQADLYRHRTRIPKKDIKNIRELK